MKYLLLAAVVLPSVLLAQSAPVPGTPVQTSSLPRPRMLTPGRQGAGETLPDNYQLNLTIADKDGQPTEISIVVASTQFNATLGDQNLSFNGTIAIDDDGIIGIAYALGWQTLVVSNGNSNYVTTSIQGSVRMKAGEEIEIIRAGTRTGKLAIKKLEPPKPK